MQKRECIVWCASPHLMPATRLACEDDCYHLIFESPPGQPLIGHPQPPRGKDALAVKYDKLKAKVDADEPIIQSDIADFTTFC